MYRVDYQTGAGNFEADTLGEAMDLADQGAAYTQKDIIIYDENGEEAARRQWWGVPTDAETQKDPIEFGCFGYYSDWIIAPY